MMMMMMYRVSGEERPILRNFGLRVKRFYVEIYNCPGECFKGLIANIFVHHVEQIFHYLHKKI